MGLIIKGLSTYRGVPKELVMNIRNKGDYKSFIETGTYKGETSIWASKIFDNVFTCEASRSIYDKLNFHNYSNIKSFYGESKDFLPTALIMSSIIYLDAHNSGGQTFNSYPLLEEIDAINNSDLNHTIIVDDARFCMSLYNDETYGELFDLINLLNFRNRYVVIFEDMLIAVPREFSSVLNDYTNKKSKLIVNSLFNVFCNRTYNFLHRIIDKVRP